MMPLSTRPPTAPRTRAIPLALTVCLAVTAGFVSMGCNADQVTFHVESGSAEAESLVVRSVITDELIATTPARDTSVHAQLSDPLAGVALLRSGTNTYLTILQPNTAKTLVVNAAGVSVRGSTADSLLNYLSRRNNEFIAEHIAAFSSTEDPRTVADSFEELRTERQEVIDANRANLSDQEFEILTYQNAARAYSFLFYYGRLMKALPPADPYFEFISRIENESVWAKTLPQNVLYRYEIEYLNQHDEISDVESFLRYVEDQTDSEDLSDFYKAVYLKEVMSSPHYWERHVRLFDTESIKRALAREQANEYSPLIEKAASAFFSSQDGQPAFNFEAQDVHGNVVSLSDFAGRLTFINVWTTWCGPCLSARPRLVELADKFSENEAVAFMAISVDATVDVWRTFLDRRDNSRFRNELIIPAGMKRSFGDRFNLRSIPRYVLIGADGRIIDANLPGDVAEIEKRIDAELEITS